MKILTRDALSSSVNWYLNCNRCLLIFMACESWLLETNLSQFCTLIGRPRKLHDKNLDGCYKNEFRRNFFYRSDILDVTAMKRKWPTKFFLKSQVSQIQKEHKMTIPIKTFS